MVTLVDYGLGNVQAFLNVYKRLNIPAVRARTPDELAQAERLILPGVGAFDYAMQRLNDSGMRDMLEERVTKKRVPILGVCVGMQMLAHGSDEGALSGLGWIDGRVRSFASALPASLPLPHMGWNDVRPMTDKPLFSGLENGARFYFLHSFFFECENGADTAASSSYGIDFSSAVSRDNVYGVQFHPEKSHRFGIRLLQNFAGV